MPFESSAVRSGSISRAPPGADAVRRAVRSRSGDASSALRPWNVRHASRQAHSPWVRHRHGRCRARNRGFSAREFEATRRAIAVSRSQLCEERERRRPGFRTDTASCSDIDLRRGTVRGDRRPRAVCTASQRNPHPRRIGRDDVFARMTDASCVATRSSLPDVSSMPQGGRFLGFVCGRTSRGRPPIPRTRARSS